MVNKAVGRREENALVTVLPVDHVRRAALVAMDLDDLAVTIHIALMPPLDGQPISDRCFHNSPSPRRYVPGLSVASPAVEIAFLAGQGRPVIPMTKQGLRLFQARGCLPEAS